MNGLRAHSFDQSRRRAAPRELVGTTLEGEPWSTTIAALTLIIAVKPRCDGCRTLLDSSFEDFKGLDVLFVSAAAPEDGEWDHRRWPVALAPLALAQLEMTSPPYYVLVDPIASRVVAEGVPFTPAQIMSEITSSRS